MAKNKKFIIYLLLLLTILICLGRFGYSHYLNNYSAVKNVSDAEVSSTESSEVEVASATVATESQTICLDAGHGGSDTGAIYKNVQESDINLTVAKKVKALLEKQGYKVYMTRTADTFVAKRARAKYCNSVNASILVSIHHNAYDSDSSVDYSTALYYKDEDQKLAASILNSVSGSLDVESKGISKFDNSLLWLADMPAALSESFFITNSDEISELKNSNSDRLDEEAEGIAAGIINYFKNPDSIKTSTASDSLAIYRDDDSE